MFEGIAGSRAFVVHCLCANCQKAYATRVMVPRVEGAPADVDEFIEALEHNPVPFSCKHCESIVGELVGVTLEREAAHV